jgi:hypothetical protein
MGQTFSCFCAGFAPMRPISGFTLLSCPEADSWSAGKTGKVSSQSHTLLSFASALPVRLAQFAEETSALI